MFNILAFTKQLHITFTYLQVNYTLHLHFYKSHFYKTLTKEIKGKKGRFAVNQPRRADEEVKTGELRRGTNSVMARGNEQKPTPRGELT